MDPGSADRPLDAAIEIAVAEFGKAVNEKLSRGGQDEDQLRGPVESLFKAIGNHLGLDIIAYGEVRLKDIHARPDYAVDVGGTRVGYIELKAPERGIPPDLKFTKEERRQWENLSALPNVIYSDGISWQRFEFGKPAGSPVKFIGRFTDRRTPLQVPDHSFELLMHDFLLWEPERPRSLAKLIKMAANLCRLLRDEVEAILSGPADHKAYEDLNLLAADWRELLFPGLDDSGFADAYAQTITFALLLARVNGTSFGESSLHEIARQMSKKHSLIGRALAVLTDSDATDELTVIETLRRVIGTVDWEALDDGQTDIYAELYERFLGEYNPEIRRLSGSYYTPQPVAHAMVEFVDQILRTRLNRSWGFAADDVIAIDPAMGTGTFLIEVIRSVANTVGSKQGHGAQPARLRELFQKRLVGFEIQVAPYAVAELRLHQALKTRFQTDIPTTDVRFLTDALEDPHARQERFRAAYKIIERSRDEANRIKRETRVMVIIGNPPHIDHTKGRASWIEEPRPSGLKPLADSPRPSLDDFHSGHLGRYESELHAMPWYFWCWALWKVFDAHANDPAGVVAFVTPSSFIHGNGFAGMREYLRRTCDEGWVIELSPEGDRPEGSTRLFGEEVSRQLCISVFARYDVADKDTPAVVHRLAVEGTRDEKIEQLDKAGPDDPGFVSCQDGWRDPFHPPPRTEWAACPRLSDLMPWSSRGVTTGRSWVCAPDVATLKRRWRRFVTADLAERRRLFRESRDRRLNKPERPLPGFPPTTQTLAEENGDPLAPIQISYRSFDRQWLIPDNRLMSVPRPPLWAVRSDRQIYVTEQHVKPITSGPGLTFAALIPDMNHYNARGGRAFPLYRDGEAQVSNLSPRLLPLLRQRVRQTVGTEDLLAYIAAIVGHRAFTHRFQRDLQQPGVRVPLTADPELWRAAVQLGHEVVWLHTFGQRFFDPEHGRPHGVTELVETSGPRVKVSIPDTRARTPADFRYKQETLILHVGEGQVGPISPAVWSYEVGGMRIISHWLDYRMKNPRHKKRTSPLDNMNCETWPPAFTDELLELLTVLKRCVELEPDQADLLERVCRGPLITSADLVDAGVLPVPERMTKPPPIANPGAQTLY